MRIGSTIVVLMTLNIIALAALVGCGGKAQNCNVSPIDIEEIRADSRDLNGDLDKVMVRVRSAQDDLAAWQQRLANRRNEVPELENELVRLKKASGVTEEMVVDVEPKMQFEEEIDLAPRRAGD